MSNIPRKKHRAFKRPWWPQIAALGASVTTLALPMSVHASAITTADVSFSNTASVTDPEGGGATSNIGVSLGSSAIAQFDSNLGVLTGAQLNLSSTQTQSVWVTAADGPNTGTNHTRTTTGTGTSTAQISAAGLSHSFASITASDSCTGGRLDACVGTATTAAPNATNLIQAIDASALDSYVGNGTTNVDRAAQLLSATQSANQFTGEESTAYSIAWTGTLSATYSYLLHAAPSFDSASTLTSLILDLGTFAIGDAASLSFSLYNLSGERVGLDLDGTKVWGDSSILSAALTPFSALAAGSSQLFNAVLDTSSAGDFATHYKLLLSDADVGAAASRSTYTMDLFLTGSVADRVGTAASVPPTSVPEPSSLALLGAGMFGLLRGRRKRV